MPYWEGRRGGSSGCPNLFNLLKEPRVRDREVDEDDAHHHQHDDAAAAVPSSQLRLVLDRVADIRVARLDVLARGADLEDVRGAARR
jgi:hypothetical protein